MIRRDEEETETLRGRKIPDYAMMSYAAPYG
jgi:hypothetical protein